MCRLIPGISSRRAISGGPPRPGRRARARAGGRPASTPPAAGMAAISSSHAASEPLDLGDEGVDLVQQHPGQLAVMVIEPAGERLHQRGVLSFHLAAGQPGQQPGSRSPAISASIMSRTDLVSSELATLDTLISESSSSFSSREKYRVRYRVRSVRSRV